MYLKLGNPKAKEALAEGVNASEFRSLKGGRETLVNFPDDWTLAQAFVALTAPNGIWANHSDAPAAWVASDSEGLAALAAEHFGCKVRKGAQ